MRITYLHQYYNSPDTPGSTRSHEMAKRLAAKGHEVSIITTYRKTTRQKSWFVTERDGFTIHWLPVEYENKMSFSRRVRAFLRFSVLACPRAAKLKADVVFATSTPLTMAIPGIVAARMQGAPFVFEVRDLWPELPIAIGALRNPIAIKMARMLEKLAYWQASRVVALSPGMVEGIVACGKSSNEVDLIPNSCDLSLFQSSPDASKRFRTSMPTLGKRPFALYAGALGKVNGVGYLVTVAKAAQSINRDVAFLIIGDGIELESIRRSAVELGVLENNLFILGRRSKEEIAAAFSAASIGLSLFIDLPEMEANSANKFFDSLASGTPTCINYGGWQSDLLTKYQAGFQLSRDPKESASSVCEFLSNTQLVEQMGIRARKLAEIEFSRDEMAERLHNCLASVVK